MTAAWPSPTISGRPGTRSTHLPLAQFYAVGVDMDEPYNIYGGLQDNGSVKIPSNGPSGAITRDDWTSVGGGDGMVNVVDPTDSRWLFNAYQNGAIQRVDQKLGLARSIRPRPAAGRPAYRFNWTAPIALSPTTAGSSISAPRSCSARSTAATTGGRSRPT